MQRRILTCLILLPLLSGCAKIEHLPQLLTLKSYADYGDAADKYVDQTNELFVKLKGDIAGEHLKVGTASADVLTTYGKPILKERISARDAAAAQEKWLYRHPTEFFKSDKVYLTFDSVGKLAKWDLVPYVAKVKEAAVPAAHTQPTD